MSQVNQSISLDVGPIRLVADFLDQKAHKLPEFRARVDALAQQQRIPITVWWALLEDLYKLIPEPDLGLKIGECAKPHHAGVLGYLSMYSETLGQALLRFNRFQPLLHNLVPSVFSVEGDSVVFGWSTERRSTQLSNDVVGSGLLHFARYVTGRNDLKPSLVKTTLPAPKDPTVYERFYGCPMQFSANAQEFHFPAHLMLLPVNTKDPYMSSLLERQAEAMLEKLPREDPLIQSIQQHILAMIQDGPPEMTAVAEHLNMSERTLYRALQARGIRFKEIVNSIRFQLAKDYLGDDTLSLPEIAMLLGYADQSVFTRAFKSWSGDSPLRWRKLHAQ